MRINRKLSGKRLNFLRMGVSVQSAPQLDLPPGTHLASILRRLLPHHVYRKWILVAISEMQAEYFEALAAGQPRRARWIVLRGYLLVIQSSLHALLPGIVRRLFST